MEPPSLDPEYEPDLQSYDHIPPVEGAQSDNSPSDSSQLSMSLDSNQVFQFTPIPYSEQNEQPGANHGGYQGHETPDNISLGGWTAQGPSFNFAAPPYPVLMIGQLEWSKYSMEEPTQMLFEPQTLTDEQHSITASSGDLDIPHRRTFHTDNQHASTETGLSGPVSAWGPTGEGLSVKAPGIKRPVARHVFSGKTKARFRPCPHAFRDLPAYLKKRDSQHQLFNCFEDCHKRRFGKKGFPRRSNLLVHLRSCHGQAVPYERE